MTNTIHIAFEGIKGSGKSTLYNAICKRVLEAGISYVGYHPTAAAPPHLPVAHLLDVYPHLINCDDMMEILYAERADWHSRMINWESSLLLADRSLATSYATRWHKWGNANSTIARVDKIHVNVPVPDIIYWLECPVNIALKRIELRGQRNYGLIDQTPQRLREVYAAYHEIMQTPPPRLTATKWVKLDAGMPLPKLVDQVLGLLCDYAPHTISNQLSH